MNNLTLCQQVRFVGLRLRLKPEHSAIYSSLKRYCSISVAKSHKQCELSFNIYSKTPYCWLAKRFSACSLLKTNDTSSQADKNPKNEDELLKKAVGDEDFQNILKDFAKDFGVGSETNSLLEGIRKDIHEPETRNKDTSVEKNSEEFSTCKSELNSCDMTNEKYKEFSDTDTFVIHSYEDYLSSTNDENDIQYVDPQLEKKTLQRAKRGVSGVFDIEELVTILREENLMDIAVIAIPKELHYADLLVLATAISPRHCKAVTEIVIKHYKMKKHKSDPFVMIEGEKVSNWKAIDLGNIVLHVFLEETRALYDIESLWLFDSSYDSGGTMKRDPMFDAIEEQMAFFNSLQQTQSTEDNKDKT